MIRYGASYHERPISLHISFTAPTIATGEAFLDELTRALQSVALQKARQGRHGVKVSVVRTTHNVRKPS